jgi:hypothetical protein
MLFYFHYLFMRYLIILLIGLTPFVQSEILWGAVMVIQAILTVLCLLK